MELMKKYKNAVAEFVKYESKKQSVLGIFVTGSFVSGNISKNSDIDVFILHDKNYSQVKAKYFDNIEFECAYKSYEHFLKDLKNKNSFDINRYAQAEILYDPQNKLNDILSSARKIFKQGPKEKIKDSDKYHLKDMMEDIEDNLEKPEVLITIMNAFNLLLKMFFKKNNLWGVKEKLLLEYLNSHDTKMKLLTNYFLNSTDNTERFVSLKKIRTYVIKDVQPLPKLWATKKR